MHPRTDSILLPCHHCLLYKPKVLWTTLAVNFSLHLAPSGIVCVCVCMHVHALCVCMCVYVLSHVWLFATSWIEAHQAPLSMEFSRQEILAWVPISFSRVSFRPRDWTYVSCISNTAGRLFTIWATREVQKWWTHSLILTWDLLSPLQSDCILKSFINFVAPVIIIKVFGSLSEFYVFSVNNL